MKKIIDVLSIHSIESNIYSISEVLPQKIFKQNFECFLYFSDSEVRCTSEVDVFGDLLLCFIKNTNSRGAALSYLKDVNRANKFIITSNNTGVDYIDAMNFEDLPKFVSLNSSACSDGVGVFDLDKEWAIYSEELSEIAILGMKRKHSRAAFECFNDFAMQNEEVIEEMKNSVHSSYYHSQRMKTTAILSLYPNLLLEKEE